MFESYRSLLWRRVSRAREEERKRIAREVHDQLIQQLLLVRSRLAGVMSGTNTLDMQGIDQLHDEVGQMLTSARQICSDLRSPALNRLGLCGAIKAWLHQFQQQIDFELRFEVDYDQNLDIPEEISLELFRVLQEALINVQKHAAASLVTVKLQFYPDLITMEIRDNGIGFYIPESCDELAYRQCFGLIGMRERIELMRGGFDIYSEPNHGTCVSVQVPIGVPVLHMAERYAHDESFHALMDAGTVCAHSGWGG